MGDISIVDRVDGEEPAKDYVWEVITKGGQKLFGVLVGQRMLSDGSILSLIFDRGSPKTDVCTEVPWSAIDTIRHAKELAAWPTNKRPS